jgi:hypothetical protein
MSRLTPQAGSVDIDPVDSLLRWELSPVEIGHRPVFERYFASLTTPLSEHSFAQVYFWRDALRLMWKEIDGHLCVFCTIDGELTLFFPPIGDGGGDRALAGAFEILDAYNGPRGRRSCARVEYASDELLPRFAGHDLTFERFACDYLYSVRRMIDLNGGDLASKRQSRARFLRRFEHRAERYNAHAHATACVMLLDRWSQQRGEGSSNRDAAIKRGKEVEACKSVLPFTEQLGLAGMVVYARPRDGSDDWALRGFTLGMTLARDQACVLVEKTDLSATGLAQFIFSEFCRTEWSHLPLVNVGDDWGLESLAATKMSYRPAVLLHKYALRRTADVSASELTATAA